MTPVETQTSSPKHLFRLAERTYGQLEGATEHALLTSAVRATVALLRQHGSHSSARLGWLDDSAEPGLRGRLLQERFLVEYGAVPEVCWLLRGAVDWISRFELPCPPPEEVTLFLEIAREAVQHRLSELAWTGVVDRVRAIQRSLLPDPIPRLPGFDVAAASVPAESVGGDVFDVLPAEDGRLVLVVADASGHGLPAALEARDVVIGVRMGLLCGARLGGLVERLNEVMAGTSLSSRFVSLVLGELDAGGCFQYVNAGHPPPILVGNGPPRFLDGTGRVLGISRSYRYRLHEELLPPESALLIYTDGVVECPSPTGEELGAERLLRLAGALTHAPAASIVEQVLGEVRRHAGGGPFRDDVSLLVVKRTREAADVPLPGDWPEEQMRRGLAHPIE